MANSTATTTADATAGTLAEGRATWIIPGDGSAPTGGYRYDREMVAALREAGWTIDVLNLPGEWPQAHAADLARAEEQIAALPEGRTVIADGLAFGALGASARAHAHRLGWVALVHHPLHLETGLDEVGRERLRSRECEALRWARRVIVTSAHTARDVQAMGVPGERIAVVEPGVARAAGPVASTAVRPHRAGTVMLLCVATLTPRKGHALLLQALSGLTSLPWELHAVGSADRDPATARALVMQAQQAGLDGRVHWHGEVDEPTLWAHYAQADLLVLPSLHEGYGMVVSEALVAGLPVLCSNAGALASTLPPGAGCSVPSGDVPALRSALQRCIGDPALRSALARGAVRAAEGIPTWPAQAARFATVLEALR